MNTNNNIGTIKCKCGYSFKINKPSEVGEYDYKCPKCGEKNRLVLKKHERKATTIIKQKFYIGDVVRASCPYCQQPVKIEPKKKGITVQKCTNCNKEFAFTATERTTSNITIDPKYIGIKGKLKILRIMGKSFSLKLGTNTIGRQDDTMPSDINIEYDSSISRRCCKIDVIPQEEGGFIYKFTVLKSLNPILLNDKELCEGESLALNYGDIIQLGKTKLSFIQDNKKK